ncbi:MAG: hypothetical protein M3Z29_05255 [Pseudomonadota bacterium]|nr:hypothetical protein [Pseudomonadota bacterium]
MNKRFFVAWAVVFVVWMVGSFVPPFVQRTVGSVPTTILFGLAIAVTFVLHVIFVVIAARRANRSPGLWAALTVMFFPIGSIVGLVLFEWFSNRSNRAALERAA